jgi:hypothetical protein
MENKLQFKCAFALTRLFATPMLLLALASSCGGQSGAEGRDLGPSADVLCKSDSECGAHKCLCGICVETCSREADCSKADGWIGCEAVEKTVVASYCSADDSASLSTMICHDQGDAGSE